MSLVLPLSVLAVFFIGKPHCDWRMPSWWQESSQMKCPWERHWIPTGSRQQECRSATVSLFPEFPLRAEQVKGRFFFLLARCFHVNKTSIFEKLKYQILKKAYSFICKKKYCVWSVFPFTAACMQVKTNMGQRWFCALTAKSFVILYLCRSDSVHPVCLSFK